MRWATKATKVTKIIQNEACQCGVNKDKCVIARFCRCCCSSLFPRAGPCAIAELQVAKPA